MNSIYNNDINCLKEMGFEKQNFNFLEHAADIDLDTKITPLIYASYLGRHDISKKLLENERIDIDMAS